MNTDHLQVIALVTKEKGLELVRRQKKNMYIEDVAEFAHVLLTITEHLTVVGSTFKCFSFANSQSSLLAIQGHFCTFIFRT